VTEAGGTATDFDTRACRACLLIGLSALVAASCNRDTYNPQHELAVLSLVNRHRAEGAVCGSFGRFSPAPPLTMNAELRRAARTHSRWMGKNRVSHESSGGPIGDTPDERMQRAGYHGFWALGENVAAGQTSPAEVVEDWMGSEAHCANIMNPDFGEIGIGYAYIEGTYWTYWTQNFGAARTGELKTGTIE
jgi:uncharacterized protein YkwD